MSDVFHPGIIHHIDGHSLQVNFSTHGACASCASKALCQMSETSDKQALVWVQDPEHYHIGQEVDLHFSSQQGLFSVCLAYLIPAFVLLATLFIASGLGLSDGFSGLLALALTALYFVCLIPFRRALKQRLHICVRPR